MISVPLIYPSNSYNIIESNITSIENIQSTIITDGIATLQNDLINNLIEPITSSNASTLKYLIDSAAEPMGPTSSVQFNVDGLFRGSSSFIVSPTTLTTPSLSNGTISFTNGTISGIPIPTTSSQASNKYYVDHLTDLSRKTLIINADVTYSAKQMLNTFLYRDSIVSNEVPKYDTTASSSDLIANMNINYDGANALFYLKNTSSDENANIYLKPGTDVYFNNGSTSNSDSNIVIIKPNYILKVIIINKVTYVLMYIESNELSASDPTSKEEVVYFTARSTEINTFLASSLKVTNCLLGPYSNTISSGNLITRSAILSGQYSVNSLSGNTTYYFEEPAYYLFTSSKYYNGYLRFIVRNTTSTYNVIISNGASFVLDPNLTSITIGPKKSALIWLQFNETGTITVYLIGITLCTI